MRGLFLGARGQKPSIYDTHRVEERFFVPPVQPPAIALLIGDTSDNLPSVPA